MAKTKVTKSKKEEKVINLDSFAVPIAIVIAGLIIAFAVYFTNSRANQGATTDLKKETTTQEEGTKEESTSATVSIGDDPYIGDKSKAKIAIVEFSDYKCGHCQSHSSQVFPEIKKNYIDTGKVIYVYKEYPLSNSGVGYTTALAGACVFEQVGAEKFSQFHKDAFNTSTDADVRNLAISLGVDGGKYDSCLSSAKYKDEIEADRDEGTAAGITGTPGFVVGVIGDDGKVTGELIKGAYPFSTFEKVIGNIK